MRGGVLTRDEAAAFVAQRPVPYADAILNLLADGLPDNAIARRFNIGMRTLTRTIARMMGDAGALSRYQFGYVTALGDVR